MDAPHYLTVYRASAGSGKTFTLAAEYVAHLLRGQQWSERECRHRHILAMTFTNKATAEMKDRILHFLDALSKGTDPGIDTALAERIPNVAETELRHRAGLALQAILHDYDRFHVETIDTFFQRLLASLAHELHLPANLKVDINDKEVADQAVDRLLCELPQRPQLREWIKTYIRLRVDDNEHWRISDAIKKFARKNVLSEAYQTHERGLHDKVSDNTWMKQYRSRLQRLRAETIASLAELAKPILAVLDAHDADTFDNKGTILRNYLTRNIKDASEHPNKTVLEYIGNPSKILRAEFRKDPSLTALAEEMSTLSDRFEQQRRMAEPIINSCDLTLKNINPLRLLNDISDTMDTIDREHNRFLLARTKLLFHEMVSHSDAPFIFEKAGTRYRHILIDEFQDTARTQWENIRTLLLDKTASGDNCLLVGDVKQSIYRWNGGDWSILQNIEKEFPAGINAVSLNDNHRSDGHIVRFNNAFFPRAATLLDNACGTEIITKIYADVAQRVTRQEDGGYVRLTINTSKNKENGPLALPDTTESDGNDSSLVAQIRRLTAAGLPQSDMAILVRKKKETQTLLRHFALYAPDIRLVSDEAFFLSASPAVMLLINALRYLHDEHHSVARAYVAQTYQHFILQADCSLADLLQNLPAHLPAEFEEQRDLLRDMPLYELCLRLMELFDYNQLFRRPETTGQGTFVAALLDEVLDFLNSNPSDTELFLSHWDNTLTEKGIPSAEADGVRIMTIHKAKGLAFHTVFIPFCDWDTENQKQLNKDIKWWMPQDKGEFSGLPIVPVTPVKAASCSIYADQYAEELLQLRIDNLNLAYVAFTRPRHNLYVWCQAQSDSSKASKTEKIGTIGQVIGKVLLTGELAEMTDRSPEENPALHIFESGSPVTTPDKVKLISTERVQAQIYPTKAAFRQSRNAEVFLDSNDNDPPAYEPQNTARGKLLHRVLENIRVATDIRPTIRSLAQSGIFPHTMQPEKLANYLNDRIADPHKADPHILSWFSGAWNTHTECTLLLRTADGTLRTVRPDRVMTNGQETIVLDFKFAHAAPQHHQQVMDYMKHLRDMGYPNVRGFLWYVDTNRLEEVVSSLPQNSKSD